MSEYTAVATAMVGVTVAVELAWLRTGVFRTRAYWIAMAIVFFFQSLVDGWLTKLSAPIVIYLHRGHPLARAPFDVPVDDFLYGFALVTTTILLWERRRRMESR